MRGPFPPPRCGYSMLSFFRSGITSKLMLVVLGIGLFAIVATGFGTGGTGGLGTLSAGGGARLAAAGSEELGTAEVTDQVRRQFDQARQQRPDLDMATFLAAGPYEEIVKQMVSLKALAAFAKDVGIGASKRQIDGEIASIPAFHNVAGKFDEATFRAALQRERVSEEMLRRDIAGGLLQRQLLLPIAASAQVPEGLASEYARLLLETRSGSVAFVPAAAFAGGTPPTDAEIAAFYRTNQGRYTVPERRVLKYATFGTAQAAAARPTDAELQAFYRSNAAAYAAKETRTLSQVILPSRDAAQALAAKVAAGTSFTVAAQAAGFAPSDTAVGAQSREQFARLSSPAIADAAFAAKQGAATAPIQSPLGWHVVHVDAVTPTPARTFADARSEIERQLTQQKTQEAAGALVNRIEDAIGDGQSFDEIVRAEKLTPMQTPPVTGAGAVSAGTPLPPQEVAPLLRAGFEMAPDEDPVVETLKPNEQFALLAVGEVLPAAPAPLAEIRERVRGDFLRQRADARARTVANAITAKVNAGTALARAVAEAGVPLPAPKAVRAKRLDISRRNQEAPAPLVMMFSIPKGKARLLPAPEGAGWFVVHLSDITQGDLKTAPGLVQATRTQFGRVMGDEYAEQFARAIERSVKVKRDDAAIGTLKAELAKGR